jgi:hypothetical protein
MPRPQRFGIPREGCKCRARRNMGFACEFSDDSYPAIWNDRASSCPYSIDKIYQYVINANGEYLFWKSKW